MKNGLAVWHYPHRTTAENLRYFAANGFDALSVNGDAFVKDLSNDDTANEIAEVLRMRAAPFSPFTTVCLESTMRIPSHHFRKVLKRSSRGRKSTDLSKYCPSMYLPSSEII